MIVFRNLRFKNFLSTGNAFTEIQLDRNGRTLIIGKNGAGKSAMLDALSFVLYSKPFRKVNKPQLINSVNLKEALVEVEFDIGEAQYLVRRGLRPHLFEIYKNGDLINQEASLRDYQEFFERNVLKMNHHAFCQVVVLGSATYTPFMNLPAGQRREVVEDLLDIQIFSTMNALIKDRMAKNKEAQTKAKYDLDLARELLDMHKRNAATASETKADRVAVLQARIEAQQQLVDTYNVQSSALRAEMIEMSKEIDKLAAAPPKFEKLLVIINKMIEKRDGFEKRLKFYSDHDDCSECHQKLNDALKSEQIEFNQSKIAEINDAMPRVKEAYQAAKDDTQRHRELTETRRKKLTENSQLNVSIKNATDRITEIQEDIAALENAEAIKLDPNAPTAEELAARLRAAEAAQEELSNAGVILSYGTSLLKDSGIKGQIIKQYIPIMNTLINKYLSEMDFFVQFELDEQFNEKIKSRFRDEFSYQSFSEGEKFRMNIAILFAWRQLARMRNSASTNLLIMDEVFDSSLDAGGVDEFMKIIKELTKDTNLFVISHRGDALIDKFDSVIQFEKVGNFSRMVE